MTEPAEISVRQIDPGDNVRTNLGKLDELMASIRELGIVVPLVLRPKGTRFEIVAGHRRYRAARRLRMRTVPAVVREVPDENVTAFMIAENVHRRGLNATDVGEALVRMRDEQGLSAAEIAQRVGKSTAWVYQHFKLMSLPLEVREAVRRGDKTLSGAIGYDKKPAGAGVIGGHPGQSDVTGMVFVVVGLHGSGAPDVKVCANADRAGEIRQRLANQRLRAFTFPREVDRTGPSVDGFEVFERPRPRAV